MSKRLSHWTKWWIPCLLATAMTMLAGCDAGLGWADGAGGDGITVPTVTVRLVNQSSVAVDPHLYISDDVVDADDLFIDTSIYADFNDKTTLTAAQTISLTLSLADVGTIGCDQAIFGGWNDADEAGQADDRLVLQRGDDFNANDIIVLTFGPGADDAYHVTATVIAK